MVRRKLLLALVPVLALVCVTEAQAGPRVYVGIGGRPVVYYRPYSNFRYYYGPGPVVVTVAPAYVVPAQPPTVYVVPAPAPAPVYVPAPAPAPMLLPAPPTAAPVLPPPPPAAIPTLPPPPPAK